MMSEKVENVLGFGDHGSAFGGSPICASGALSIVERLTDDFLEEVDKKSKYVFDALSNVKGVTSVSGKGLMIGVKTEKPAKEIVSNCIEKGALFLTAKDKVRLLPALNIPFEMLKKAIDILISAITE